MTMIKLLSLVFSEIPQNMMQEICIVTEYHYIRALTVQHEKSQSNIQTVCNMYHNTILPQSRVLESLHVGYFISPHF
jgi:hypothetical protein